MLTVTMRATVLFTVLAGATVCANAGQLEPRREVVRFDDLNLNSDAGTQALYRRIEGAARYVCSDFDRTRELRMMTLYARCQEETINNAVDLVHCTSLSALYAKKRGKSLRMVSPGSTPERNLILVSGR
jgi:UrcA family protein